MNRALMMSVFMAMAGPALAQSSVPERSLVAVEIAEIDAGMIALGEAIKLDDRDGECPKEEALKPLSESWIGKKMEAWLKCFGKPQKSAILSDGGVMHSYAAVESGSAPRIDLRVSEDGTLLDIALLETTPSKLKSNTLNIANRVWFILDVKLDQCIRTSISPESRAKLIRKIGGTALTREFRSRDGFLYMVEVSSSPDVQQDFTTQYWHTERGCRDKLAARAPMELAYR
jgi:hypothetical protein